MGDDAGADARLRTAFCISQAYKRAGYSEHCRSDVNVGIAKKDYSLGDNCPRKCEVQGHRSIRSLGEYYKKYEHDEVPVKDSNHLNCKHVGDREVSLTNTELDKLEMKIFKNMSQELQTDDSSVSSLESNIKFFKTTVQEIFDNFYANMRDYEMYKKRFNEILAKKKEEAVADMEEFIKDMIQHIMSSDTSSLSNDKSNEDVKKTVCNPSCTASNTALKNDQNVETNMEDESCSETTTNSLGGNLPTVVEAYKNDNYLTDSTLEDTTKSKRPRKEEIFNIYLLSGNPCVQIKMNDRNLLSEINIKEPCKPSETEGKHVASAENMEVLAAKKIELEKYVKQQVDYNVPDREIPVKVSYAKKNIHLNEDFTHDRDTEKSFISKICNYLCKKFRKTS